MSVPPRVRHYDRPLAGSMEEEIHMISRGRRGLRPSDTRAIYANRQTFWVEILCGLILLSYFEVVVGII